MKSGNCKIILAGMSKIDSERLQKHLELRYRVEKRESLSHSADNESGWIVAPAQRAVAEAGRHGFEKAGDAGVKPLIITFSVDKNPELKARLLSAGLDICIMGRDWGGRVVELIKQFDANSINAEALKYMALILTKTKQNQDLARTILKKLSAELPAQLALIEDALLKGNYIGAREIVHKLQGSAGFCGLEALEQAACELDKEIRGQRYADVDRHFVKLEHRMMHFICCRSRMDKIFPD